MYGRLLLTTGMIRRRNGGFLGEIRGNIHVVILKSQAKCYTGLEDMQRDFARLTPWPGEESRSSDHTYELVPSND